MTFRILIIDCDDESVKKVVPTLSEAGYEVLWACDFREAVKKLFEFNPDLVILGDVLSPGGKKDISARIRQASYKPIVVLGNREDQMETLELGADSYVIKPPNPCEIVALVRSLLRRKFVFNAYQQES